MEEQYRSRWLKATLSWVGRYQKSKARAVYDSQELKNFGIALT